MAPPGGEDGLKSLSCGEVESKPLPSETGERNLALEDSSETTVEYDIFSWKPRATACPAPLRASQLSLALSPPHKSPEGGGLKPPWSL